MYKTILTLGFAFIALVGLCLGHNINVCGGGCGGDSCCPNNTSLECCCKTYTTTYLASTKKVSYMEAVVSCLQIGMDLATVTTPEESNALTNYLMSMNPAVGAYEGFWIGAVQWTGATNYYWLKTGEAMVFSNFLPGEPNDIYDIEDCISWVRGLTTQTIGWIDLECKSKVKFVCQSRNKCI